MAAEVGVAAAGAGAATATAAVVVTVEPWQAPKSYCDQAGGALVSLQTQIGLLGTQLEHAVAS